jgi:hypothetical protein
MTVFSHLADFSYDCRGILVLYKRISTQRNALRLLALSLIRIQLGAILAPSLSWKRGYNHRAGYLHKSRGQLYF